MWSLKMNPWYFLTLVFYLMYFGVKSEDYSKTRTPFCDICTCVNQTATNPDINCSDALVLPKLFQEEMWIEKSTANSTVYYSINSIDLTGLNLGDLNQTFPKSNLKKLDLSRNAIKNITTGGFENLQDMVELILSYNNLEKLKGSAFMGLRLDGYDYPLRSLRILRLDHNNIHSLDDDIFEHLENDLEELYLGGNPFKVLDKPTTIAITGLQNLKILDLSFTSITDLPDNFLHTPKYLVKLDLSGNNLEMIPETLTDSNSLEELIIDGNPIEELTTQNGFPSVKTLRIIRMSKMPNLTEVGPHSLSKLNNLEELYLTNNNQLRKVDDKALVSENIETYVWPIIKKLDLSNNKLTHLNFTFLGKWEALESLDLRGNPWTCECENQWMLDELMEIYLDLNSIEAKEMKCAAPIEMEQFTFNDLYDRKSVMRCLDIYGNRPEKDGTMLIGMLIGILLGIPFILFLLYAYQRNWFGIFDKSPAAYSRQFYRAPALNEEF